MARAGVKSTPLLLQPGEEVEDESVHFFRLFLLDPMAGAGDKLYGAEIVGDARHLGAEGILLRAADDDVLLACDEGDRDLDAGAGELRRDLPVAVEIAVVVHP